MLTVSGCWSMISDFSAAEITLLTPQNLLLKMCGDLTSKFQWLKNQEFFLLTPPGNTLC
jgi:hypothetical protein